MNYEVGPSRSADDIEAYAKAARQREREEARAEREAEKAERAAEREAERATREAERDVEREARDAARRAREAEREADRAAAQARRDARAKAKMEQAEQEAADAKAKDEKAAELRQCACELVNTLYFVAKLDRYLIKVDHDWVYLKMEAVRKQYSAFLEEGFYSAFIRAMECYDRNFTTCTYSAKDDLGPETLNLMDRSEWVQPVEGDHHWLFDVLMQSLGGNKAENINHLEHVIYYHRMNPEYFMLPCIVLHGEGGTGKNLLVDRVLYTMFPRQTVSATADNTIGNFNGLLVGMMAALINENMAERGDMNTMKDLLHKPRLTVNIKNVPQFLADNIALFFIGVNFDSNGGVQLDRSDADRRLSVMFCERGRTLLYWIGQHQGWTKDEAEAWMTTEGDRICKDRNEVGKWLHYLDSKYRGLEAPRALHGEDFNRLMEDQKKLDDRLFEAIFNDATFTHIERKTLYAGYRAVCREENMRYPLGKKTLFRRCELWLAGHKPQITLHHHTVTRFNKRLTIHLWADTSQEHVRDAITADNATGYMAGDECHGVWQGPELN